MGSFRVILSMIMVLLACGCSMGEIRPITRIEYNYNVASSHKESFDTSQFHEGFVTGGIRVPLADNRVFLDLSVGTSLWAFNGDPEPALLLNPRIIIPLADSESIILEVDHNWFYEEDSQNTFLLFFWEKVW